MYILRSMFVISGSSLYPGFAIVRFDCTCIVIGDSICIVFLYSVVVTGATSPLGLAFAHEVRSHVYVSHVGKCTSCTCKYCVCIVNNLMIYNILLLCAIYSFTYVHTLGIVSPNVDNMNHTVYVLSMVLHLYVCTCTHACI